MTSSLVDRVRERLAAQTSGALCPGSHVIAPSTAAAHGAPWPGSAGPALATGIDAVRVTAMNPIAAQRHIVDS